MVLAKKDDPFQHFGEWFAEANAAEALAGTPMSLATVDGSGLPNVRMVLLKGWDEDGFVFYSNAQSQKGEELSANMKAAICFHWSTLRRQVRIRGAVEVVSDEDADEYFASRPRGSRLGAWASKQSAPLEGRFALEAAVAKFALKYPIGAIPRPDFWKGYRVKPDWIEFWLHRDSRLHDRLVYTAAGDGWASEWLYP